MMCNFHVFLGVFRKLLKSAQFKWKPIFHFRFVLLLPEVFERLLEQKYYSHQPKQFVTAAAICADETLISLNIFNSNGHAHAAQQNREGKRDRCAA